MPSICAPLRILFAAATLLVAGCATGPATPPPPYMTPYPAAGYDYGHAEERLGPDLWRVVYHGPWWRLDPEAASPRGELDRAAAEAADLALWRAAQLALAADQPAFAIVDRRTDTETHRRRGTWVDDPGWHTSGYPYGRYGLISRPWPATYYLPGDARGRARATMTIRLERRVTAANIDAAATVKRLQPFYDRAPPAR
jgi:hypothetical protein